MGRAVARLRRREMLALAVAVVGLGLLVRLMLAWPLDQRGAGGPGLAEAIWTTLRENGARPGRPHRRVDGAARDPGRHRPDRTPRPGAPLEPAA